MIRSDTRSVIAGSPARRGHSLTRQETNMDATSLVVFLAIGAVAGWLAGQLLKGGGFGLIGNIVVGIVGAFVGGFAFSLLGVSAGGLVGSIITATVGAIILLVIVGIIKRAA
jgi:uncharacterized membrane protein YeaQ/YmgE (transglycosylase-associated protein family)